MAARVRTPIYLLQPLPEEPPALPYWRALWRRRYLMALWLAVGMIAGFAWPFIRPPRYMARAVIRPVEPSDVLGGLGANSGLLGLAMAGKGENQAYRFIGMLNSRQCLFRVIKEQGLESQPQLFGRGLPGQMMGRWPALRALAAATTVSYDARQGNIVLQLTLRQAAAARKVLRALIDDLRESLRTRELTDSRASVKSLEQQIEQTSDPLLRQQLYQQIAYDLHRAATAKVEADFAFEIIDPPSVDPRPVGAGPLKCAALGFVIMAIIGACLCWWCDYLTASELREFQDLK